MAADRPSDSRSSHVGLPLKRQHNDRLFWARLAALWHRERMREAYVAAGDSSAEARHLANTEALEIIREFGFKIDRRQLKADLAELVVNELPGRGRSDPTRGVRYWEERVQVDILRMLALEPGSIRSQLLYYLEREVARNGPFYGRVGFYKLTHIVGYTPSMEHMLKRGAFLDALHEIGHDPDYADREIYKVVLRLLRDYTRRPFETRLGLPMPRTKRPLPRRGLFGFGRPRTGS